MFVCSLFFNLYSFFPLDYLSSFYFTLFKNRHRHTSAEFAPWIVFSVGSFRSSFERISAISNWCSFNALSASCHGEMRQSWCTATSHREKQRHKKPSLQHDAVGYVANMPCSTACEAFIPNCATCLSAKRGHQAQAVLSPLALLLPISLLAFCGALSGGQHCIELLLDTTCSEQILS